MKICPLLSIGVQRDKNMFVEDYCECVQDRCAMWVKDKQSKINWDNNKPYIEKECIDRNYCGLRSKG